MRAARPLQSSAKSVRARTASSSTSKPLRVAILISGRGSNMATIVRECQQKRVAATVSVVISDRPGVAGITTAADMGIETLVVSRKAAADREAFEKTLSEALDSHTPDLVV